MQNGFELNNRQLQRIINGMGLKRKGITENLQKIVAAILTELDESGSCLGYKSMWHRLKIYYGLAVYRESVPILLQALDPEGVEMRARYTLHQRVYCVPGPNFAWNTDKYDKRKPFGFSIHGCVDGYSRKVLWFELGTTNNKSQVINRYFLKAVKKFCCVPSLVTLDNSTENRMNSTSIQMGS